MPLLVMKFGGTSVADLVRIKNAAQKIKYEVARGYDVIVIVSAMSGKTNELIGWVNETSPLYDAREYDAVVSAGENVTAGLMALTLQEMEVPARSWQGWQVPIRAKTSTRNLPKECVSPLLQASKVSPPRGGSQRWAGADLTLRRSPLQPHLTQSAAIFILMLTAFTLPTRASHRKLAG
jgi:hypothetical protein